MKINDQEMELLLADNQHIRMIEKAPIIEENGRIVHLSDFVNDIFYNKDERFRKQDAMDDFEAVIDYINKMQEEKEQ